MTAGPEAMTEPWRDAIGDRPWVALPAVIPAGRYDHRAARVLQLRLIRRGSSYLRLDLGAGPRRAYTRPGDLLLSLPHSPTTFEVDQPRRLSVVCLAPGHATALLVRAGGTALPDLAPLTTGPFRNPLVAELCRRLAEPGDHAPATLEAAVAVLVAALLDQARSVTARPRGSRLTGASLQRVLDAVEERLADPLPVDELAGIAGMPRRPFAAEFKRAVGMPVHQYVLRRRVDRAVALLTGTDRPIAEIAAEAGFAHQAHLTRVLRRMTGATPAQHRAR